MAVTNTAWLEAVWKQEAVSLQGSKTDFLPMDLALPLLQLPQQPSGAQLLAVLRHMLAVYEAKTSKHVAGKLLDHDTCLQNLGFLRMCLEDVYVPRVY